MAPESRFAPYAISRAEVLDMFEAGCGFRDMEDLISDSRLSEEQRAALWLLAWSLCERESAEEEWPELAGIGIAAPPPSRRVHPLSMPVGLG